MGTKKTSFNVDWTNSQLNPNWSWLKSVDGDIFKAECIICKRIFCLSNMGRQAIVSHEQSVKHRKNLEISKSSNSIKSFLNLKSPSNVCNTKHIDEVTELVSVTTHKTQSSVEDFTIKDKTLQAEIIWAMKLVMSHSSYHAFKDAANIFQIMFPDSQIAKDMTIGNNKMSYLICFGIAPYFTKLLLSELSDVNFVICFDEALNRVSQKSQMDLVVRYWSTSRNLVCTRYLNSVFMGHATANDLVEKFKEGINGLDIHKLLQISMDGPNVNLKFLRNINEHFSEEKDCHLLELGTCGLHVIHGAFRIGHRETGWNLNEIFRALYQLFKDSPARRADYISITESNIFPLKFCQVRWVENVNVAERAIKVFSNIKTYVAKSDLPKTTTCDKIKVVCNDKLILAKISFFSSVATILLPFLKEFQTSKPMVPFLFDSLYDILHQLMSRFLKQDVIKEATTVNKLLKINLADKVNFRKVLDTDIGVGAGAELTKIVISDLQKREFFTDCQQFLLKTALKIIERSPLNYPFVRFVSCLNPKLIVTNSILCEARMNSLLQVLYKKNLITSVVGDQAKQQFSTLCNRAKNEWILNFSSFSRKCRLDVFYSTLLIDEENFDSLFKVIKMILILSHGNATVESGFSVNKDMIVENLKDRSLISLRIVYDAIQSNGGISNTSVTKELMSSAKKSRARYQFCLEEQKNILDEEKKQADVKRKISDQIKLLKKKKAKLSHDVDVETKNIDFEITELSKKL